MTFPFAQCATWVRDRAKYLESLGCRAQVIENVSPVQTILLRVSGSSFEADLVVWDTGSTSMQISDVVRSDLDLHRDDIVLTDGRFSDALKMFFDRLVTAQGKT